MRTSIAVTRGIVGVTGIVQLALGVLFWLGIGRTLISLAGALVARAGGTPAARWGRVLSHGSASRG